MSNLVVSSAGGSVPQVIPGFGLNILAFGADPTGAADSAPAIQAAINAAITQGVNAVFFPSGIYLVNSTIATNNNPTGHGNLSVGLQLVGQAANFGTTLGLSGPTLVWGGAAHGVIFMIREAINGRMRNIAFDGSGIADIALQLLHVPSQDGQDVENWFIDECSFIEALLYDTLLGDVSVDGLGAAGSLISNTFYNCYWRPNSSGATHTAASVFQRSANAVGNMLINPTLGGSGGYPQDGVVVESGTMKTIGGLSQVQRELHGGHGDFYLPTPGGISPQVPGGLTVVGFDSQSSQFIEIDAAASAAAQNPVVLDGCFHSDTFGTGVFSIKWNRGGFATLSVNGGHYTEPVTILTNERNVFINGAQLNKGLSGAGNVDDAVEGQWISGDTPNRIDLTKAYTLPLSSATAAIGLHFVPDPENSSYDIIVDVTAWNLADGSDAAVWENLRASYVAGGGTISTVINEAGLVSPTHQVGGTSASWLVKLSRNVAANAVDVLIYAGNIAHATQWKIRFQAIQATQGEPGGP